MAERLEGNDWMGEVICPSCWTIPCQCSRLTNLIEHIAIDLMHLTRVRQRRRQEQLRQGKK